MVKQKLRAITDYADDPIDDERGVPYLCGASAQDSQELSGLGCAISGPEKGCLACSC